MDSHVKEFFRQFSDDTPKGNFHKVIAIHENTELSWESVAELVPQMPRGWFELAHLDVQDKKDFLLEFWLGKLPYHAKFPQFITNFFNSLDDIGIYLFKRTFDDPFEAQIIYSLKDDGGFFRGATPATDQEIIDLKKSFSDYIFPEDFLNFLLIHNGFNKTTDITGIISSSKLIGQYKDFQSILEQEKETLTNRGTAVNPKTLIPFYESFGMPFYQCFWAEWYPENEMGNVYYSGITKTISDVESSDPSSDGMAFPTFLDWLIFYMERIE